MAEPAGLAGRPGAVRAILRLLAAMALVVAGCSGTVGPTPTPTPTPGPPLSQPALKLVLIARLGPLWYCDPDFYPLARGPEIDQARARWAEVVADTGAFTAITASLGLDPAGSFTDDQKLLVYQRWKQLRAIALDQVAGGGFAFDYLAMPGGSGTSGTRSVGRISASGAVSVTSQSAAGAPNCPICLPRGTRIEAPGGAVTVESLRLGDVVWTLDPAGRRVPATVIALGSVAVPPTHQVVRLVLADGRSVTASPGHPLADGRRLGDVAPGDVVDGSPVIAAGLRPYAGGRTYDLEVSGPTGLYLVDGIALASTLTRSVDAQP